MRHTAWALVLSILVGCYLAPEKHEGEDGLDIIPGAATSDGGHADAGKRPSCTTAETCPSDAPLCTNGTCASCTQHDQCTRFATTPACGPQGTCIPCTSDEARACAASTPACDPTANQCVQCLTDDHCTDPLRGACNPGTHTCERCISSEDCAHIFGKNICHEGTCVACTRTNIAACVEGVAGGSPVQYVCDPGSSTCDRMRPARSKEACQTCISDVECTRGSVCVDLAAGAGQLVCMPVRTQAPCPRPYVGSSSEPLVTADGELAAVCTLGVETTTCEAHRHYRNQRCGTPVAPGANQDIEGSGNNDRCGAPGLHDGYCIWSPSFRQHLCTVPCNNNVSDCPVDAATCTIQAHAGILPRNLCSF